LILYDTLCYVYVEGVCYSADFLSLCVMVHLLWPTRSYFYFNLDRLQTRVDLDDLGYSGLSLSLLTIHFTLLRLVNLHLHYITFTCCCTVKRVKSTNLSSVCHVARMK